MICKIDEFCYNVSANLNSFIDELVKKTGRAGQNEKDAWARSLPEVSAVLQTSEMNDFHLYLGEKGTIITEYRLPSSSSWCDIVLLGNDGVKPSVMIIELKDWDTKSSEEGPSENLIKHNGRITLHPSDQVRGYVNYSKRFHSTVQENNASVNGCVYFTSSEDASIYSSGIHTTLTREYPVFTRSEIDFEIFPKYLKTYLRKPDEGFAKSFEQGYYKQDRSLVIQVAKNFTDGAKPFELLDEQRKGFEICKKEMLRVIENGEKKKVIIIKGGPGSGKSVLAVNLWAEAVRQTNGEKNIVFTTTSGSQRSNWESLFQSYGRNRAAHGIVMPANRFNPGLSPTWQRHQIDSGRSVTVESWRENLELFETENTPRTANNMFFMSIVDEAHALIDPAKPGRRGIPPSGWSVHAGPQGWHIIKCSEISVFLLDGDQSYRDNETTTILDILDYAADFDAEIIEIDLSDSQFRCGGSLEYINWIEDLLEFETGDEKPIKSFDDQFEFKIYDYLDEMESVLKKKNDEGNQVRLASSYSRDWLTKKEPNPHELEAEEMDFYFKYRKNDEIIEWSKIWNFAPNQNYTLFIQARKGSKMHEDPLCEVGCPYVIRGFDYDYIGLLWLKDLIYRDKWIVQPEHVFESSIRNTRARARREGSGSQAYEDFLRRILKGYRILLTRPIKGIYLWFEDQETREYVEKKLGELV